MRTVSGIRGTIKKAMRAGGGRGVFLAAAPPPCPLDTALYTTCPSNSVFAGADGHKDGTCRVAFEDKPLLSDIVFLRAWVAVPLPQVTPWRSNLGGGAEQGTVRLLPL